VRDIGYTHQNALTHQQGEPDCSLAPPLFQSISWHSFTASPVILSEAKNLPVLKILRCAQDDNLSIGSKSRTTANALPRRNLNPAARDKRE
jgi:hypothetical protein